MGQIKIASVNALPKNSAPLVGGLISCFFQPGVFRSRVNIGHGSLKSLYVGKNNRFTGRIISNCKN